MLLDFLVNGPKQIPYVPYKQRKNLPAISGIYFVKTETEESTVIFISEPGNTMVASDYEESFVLYVGMSQNINKRWIKHHIAPEIEILEKCGAECYIHWIEYPYDEAWLLAMEADLIKNLDPLLNKTHRPRDSWL